MKKSKTVSLPKKSSDPSNSCVSDLLDLLAQINGGKPIELKVIAAIKEASSRFDGFGGIGRHHWVCNKREDPNITETLLMQLNSIFTKHIGKTPRIIIENALRTTKEDFTRERKGEEYWCETKTQLNHPTFPDHIYGPNSDGKVWLPLFLGQEQADELLYPKTTAPMNSKERMNDDSLKPTEEVVHNSIYDAYHLSLHVLMYNILKYIRMLIDDKKMPIIELLRFSVLYGLDGVMKDILLGHYGDHDGDLTVNSLVPFGRYATHASR